MQKYDIFHANMFVWKLTFTIFSWEVNITYAFPWISVAFPMRKVACLVSRAHLSEKGSCFSCTFFLCVIPKYKTHFKFGRWGKAKFFFSCQNTNEPMFFIRNIILLNGQNYPKWVETWKLYEFTVKVHFHYDWIT